MGERGAFLRVLDDYADRAFSNLRYRAFVPEHVLRDAAAIIEDQRATIDALRASLDPDNAEAVATWAIALQHIDPADLRLGRDLRPPAAALLRARREAAGL